MPLIDGGIINSIARLHLVGYLSWVKLLQFLPTTLSSNFAKIDRIRHATPGKEKSLSSVTHQLHIHQSMYSSISILLDYAYSFRARSEYNILQCTVQRKCTVQTCCTYTFRETQISFPSLDGSIFFLMRRTVVCFITVRPKITDSMFTARTGNTLCTLPVG
jgi:hypothetical protein